jgi:hypothetical protein
MISSRQKPESARMMISVSGQRVRIWATMRASSATLPAEASMLDERRRAHRRCSPQKMYSGRVRGGPCGPPLP